MPVSFELIPAPPESQAVLENLMSMYLHDFSEFTGDDADDQGRFCDEHLPRYWVEPGRYPFLVLVNGKYAGFVLVRQVMEPDGVTLTNHIAEFFVMRKYRRQGLGQQVAWQVFDRFPGCWHVAQMRENELAQQFWRKVIAAYTRGNYREIQLPDWDGPVQAFDMPAREPGADCAGSWTTS